jgi:F-box/TPR repeat protein Pof3
MARTMSPDEYQELGRRYYKQKQYEKAVEAFTEGIETANSQSMSLFDHRAAGYDKLAKFSLAVRDGRDMIKLDKQNVKVSKLHAKQNISNGTQGYLRTGSVLEKTGKLETAVGIYKYGMKNVPITDPNFKVCLRFKSLGSEIQAHCVQVLQQLHDRITRKLSPAKAVDPFTVLPVELVEMVLGYLSFKTMVNCMRVSKEWKTFLVKLPNLWTDLDFSGARKSVSKAFIREAVFRSEYRITRATVHRISDFQIFVNVATACKGLTSLEFLSGDLTSKTFIDIAQCATNLKKLIIHTDITLDTATQILRWRPTLHHVEFRSLLSTSLSSPDWKGPFPSLHTLLIKEIKGGNAYTADVGKLCSQTPALQSLTLINCYLPDDLNLHQLPLTHLVLWYTQAHVLHEFPRLPPTLRELTFHPRVQISLPLPPDPQALGLNMAPILQWQNISYSHLPNLTHLSFANVQNLSPAFLSALLDMYVKVEGDGESTPIPANERPPVSMLEHFSLMDSLSSPNVTNYFGPGGLFISSPRILSNSLKYLNIATLPCGDDDIETMLTHPGGINLHTLDISQTKVTGASVKMLADGLPNLKYLILNNCHKISSRDAIHYAEKKGISVSCQMGETKGGGKRLRYG